MGQGEDAGDNNITLAFSDFSLDIAGSISRDKMEKRNGFVLRFPFRLSQLSIETLFATETAYFSSLLTFTPYQSARVLSLGFRISFCHLSNPNNLSLISRLFVGPMIIDAAFVSVAISRCMSFADNSSVLIRCDLSWLL